MLYLQNTQHLNNNVIEFASIIDLHHRFNLLFNDT